MPVIALSARDLGASVAVAGLVVALTGVGLVLGDVPAGWVAGRIGERQAMVLSAALAVAALVACILATNLLVLAAAICATGLSAAVWGLARQAYITDLATPEMRARALSTLGGCSRIGMFVGPFLSAGAMAFTGTDGAYGIHLLMAVLAALVLLRLPDARPRSDPGAAPVRVLTTIREQLPVLRTLGIGVLLVNAVRTSRQVVIPLWGDQIGLDPTTITLVFGLSGAVDMLLFYPAGYVMDRFGRVWAAVPSMLVLSVAHLLLPLTTGVAGFAAVAVVMGIGNGMGSGIIMTLGADSSPASGRSAFLGAWRLCADAGAGVGPLLLSGVTAVAALAPAVVVMGGMGLLAAGALARWTPRRPGRAGRPGGPGRPEQPAVPVERPHLGKAP